MSEPVSGRMESPLFRMRAVEALNNPTLQAALGRARGGFVDRRRAAVDAYADFDALRAAGAAIRERTLARLDDHLQAFESQVLAQGGRVHWAADAAEARRIIVGLCRDAGARRIAKAKTMAGEEIALNEALEAAGMTPIETDLGEYIIQLAKEPPSHIIAPAVHKTREEICALFDQHHHGGALGEKLREVPELVAEARRLLRDQFLNADVGISGANSLIAETGQIITVTNEGNADLSDSLPQRHIVIAGIEKVVPTLEDATVLLRLLARSATGQAMTAYTSFLAGPRRAGDVDGPGAFDVVLLDNGRSRMLGGPFREMLRCIRCGACLNHCPVYGAVGGHAYGWVYPGPMGAVLTPLMVGLDKSLDLPNACTLNGRCESVCPVNIPLPKLLRQLRERQFDGALVPLMTRRGLGLWAWVAQRPRLYALTTRIAAWLLHRLAGRRGALRWLPLAGGWTASRDFPAPAGDTFQARWQRAQRR